MLQTDGHSARRHDPARWGRIFVSDARLSSASTSESVSSAVLLSGSAVAFKNNGSASSLHHPGSVLLLDHLVFFVLSLSPTGSF